MTIALAIVTPSGQAFDGEAERVVLPGAEGEFAVLEQHERFLAPLQPGALAIHTAVGVEWAAVSDGFADVSAEKVVVLVDSCQSAEEIDVAQVERERSHAAAALVELGVAAEDDARRSELERQLALAEARLQVASRS